MGLSICLLCFVQQANAQFTVTENFRGSGGPDIILDETAKFTSGDEDPVGAGWLRLTSDANNVKGAAYINRSFPSTQGVLIDFEYTMWRDHEFTYNGADGISVFLFDAQYGPEADGTQFDLGAYGGSLGYANSTDSSPASGGLSGGYIGIGLDAYGNFTRESEGKNGGSTNVSPNSVTLRGGTTGTSPSNNSTNPYLAGVTITGVNAATGVISFAPDALTESGNADFDGVDYNTLTPTNTRPAHTTFYRRVQIEILPVADNNYKITVRMAAEFGGTFTDLITYTTAVPPPPLLKLGFAASTGGGVNNHEIRNLMITTLGNLRVYKSADVDILRSQSSPTGPSNEITYNIEVTNATQATLNNISFEDQVTDGNGNPIPDGMFEITSITTSSEFLPGTTLPNPTAAAPITNGKFIGLLKLPVNTTGIITVQGHLNSVPKWNLLTNTTTVNAVDITDTDLSNNTSSVSTPVVSEQSDLVISSTVDKACLDGTNGNTFTLNVRNIGLEDLIYGNLPGNEITVTTTLPAGASVTNQTNTGWTPTQSGNILTFVKDAGGPAVLAYNEVLPPITYTLTNATGYTHNVQVASQTEDPGNVYNNTDSNEVASPPNAPSIPSATLTYCQYAEAMPLTATANNGNILLWSLSDGGVTTSIPYTPNTSEAGTTTYWVAQETPGGCVSDFTQITVNVTGAAAVDPGSIGSNQEVCPGTQAPALLTSIDDGDTGAGLSYIWQKSTDNGNTWATIPEATSATFQPLALTEITFFRRATVNTSGCQYTTEPIGIYMATGGNCAIALCTAEVPGASFEWKESNSTSSPVTQTLIQPATNAGFVFDIYVLDNSFNMEINGVQLAVNEIEFQSNGTPPPGINIQFQDGDQYEANTEGDIWEMTGEPGKPLVRVEISPSGTINMYGSKVSSTDPNYQLYPLEFIPAKGNSFNTIHWNTTGNNTIVVTQNVVGATTMTGYGYGQSLAPCDPYSLSKEGMFNDENANGYAELGETITYTLTLANSGDIDIFQPEVSDPMFGGEITATPMGDVNNDDVLNTTETWTYSVQYAVTQPEIDFGGVYNQAAVNGKTIEGYLLDPVQSTDPTPLDPGNTYYDPNRPDHTFVRLPPPVVITNPMLYNKVKNN